MPSVSEKTFRVEFAEFSDLGMRRSNNQDAVASVVRTADKSSPGRWRGDVFVVADGMGAHAAGELASKLAADSLPHTYQKLTELAPPAALRQAVRKANTLIHAKGQSSPEFQGMGTTCSTLVLLGDAALIAHVGDSRVYRLRDASLEQLTFDHSLVWEMAAAAQTDAEDVPACIPKNVITRSLGPHKQVNVDLEGPHPLADGDTFLLCSDGLTGVVEDSLIGAVLGAMAPVEAGQTLVDIANLRGGPDNISVVIARVSRDPSSCCDSEAACCNDPELHSLFGLRGLFGAALAACFIAVAWFGSREEYAWAGVSAAAACVLGFVGATYRERPPLPAGDALGGPYGDGPYRQTDCGSGEPAAAAIGAVIEQLAEVEATDPTTSPPVKDWAPFHEHRTAGAAASGKGDQDTAIRSYAAAIRSLMDQVRADRTEEMPAGRVF